MSATSAERPDLLSPAQKLEVEEQLLRISNSAAFSASPRSQQLLTYLVKHSIAGSYDRQRPGVAWKLERNGKGREAVDYAVVTRLLHSETGQVVVEASGITQYGCRAAGELIVSNVLFEKSLGGAPKGWESKNLQIVLRSKVVGMTAGAPEILSTYFW